MTTHELKTRPVYFREIIKGKKTFEVRKHDRNFQVDDILILKEYKPQAEGYTGRETRVRITYKMMGGVFGVGKGYCVLGIKDMEQS